jgi:hypothetical protein
VTEWDVDIISMSFAVNLPVTDEKRIEIKNIIDKNGKKVIMFAAARNDGYNKLVAFPASHRDVICIRATTWLGHLAKTSPPPDEESGNFATLGEDVRSAWLDTEECKSGTSFATPIAVAYYACVLAFASQYFSDKDYELLHSLEGAWKLFKCSVQRDSDPKHRYINPEFLFRRDDSNESIKEYILRELRSSE